MNRKSKWTSVVFTCVVLGMMLTACGGEEELKFMDFCNSSDQCPNGYVCPDFNASGTGAIWQICTPVCDTDSDCTGELGRLDVKCKFGFCIQTCTSHDDCPSTLDRCRGANYSCEGLLPPPLWCAQEDMWCK